MFGSIPGYGILYQSGEARSAAQRMEARDHAPETRACR